MKIVFYKKSDGCDMKETDNHYFVMNNEVYRDNYESFESQEASIGFDDCIARCPDISWRITQN